METIDCPHCYSPIDPRATRCPHCGQAVRTASGSYKLGTLFMAAGGLGAAVLFLSGEAVLGTMALAIAGIGALMRIMS